MGGGETGLCHMHRLRLLRTGQLNLTVRERPTCAASGCSVTARAQGMCQRHYDRHRGSRRRATHMCSETDCVRSVKARGLCPTHYAQLQRHGALHAAPRRLTVRSEGVRLRRCRGCGADLGGLTRGRRYCSDDCKPKCTGPGCDRRACGRGLCSTHLKHYNNGDELRVINERDARAPNQPCKWCDEPVGPESRASYCSIVCRSLARRHIIAATTGTCAQCGSAINYLAPANGTSQRLTPVSKRLCDQCRHRSASLYISADALRQRDGDACHLCGLDVPAAQKPHPLAPEVDHILPISRGGTHDPENLALSHRTCNIAKGNRPATWRRDPGEVEPLLAVWNRDHRSEPPRKCSVVDCERRSDSHGMCQKHRRRVMKHGTTELNRGPTVCTILECDGPIRAKGRCRKHYRMYLQGDKTCGLGGCSKRVHTRGLCRRHYQGWLDSRWEPVG